MKRIAVGVVGVAALGAALFSAPLLWSQSPGGAAQGPAARTPWWQTGRSDRERSDDEDARPARDFGRDDSGRDDFGGRGGFRGPGGGPGGPGGGPGGFGGGERKLIEQFDLDGDGILNLAERKAAREAAGGGRGDRGRGGRGGPGGGPGGRNREPAQPGPKVSPADVAHYPDASLYESTVLRTLFLEFESENWEDELAAFKGTDVDVPATLTVDGKTYPNVGVHFRGMSSYMMVPAGYKRSLNLSLDLVDSEQRLYGYKTLNLLNCAGDSTLLSSVLYSHIARQHFPAPKANFVKVVINGESWGLYCNVQQFDKQFLKENYASDKGARWKVPGNPGADGGLRYLGDNIEDYRRRFEIKSKDEEESWRELINLCRVLNETPTDQLEEAISPILDIDSTLWFLAMDVAVANSDGYWTRSSDYYIFKESGGKFYIAPHDMNEAFQGMGGPGGPGGPMGGPGGPMGGPMGGRGGEFSGGPMGGPMGGPGGEFSGGPMGGPMGGPGGEFSGGPMGGPDMPGGFPGNFGPPQGAGMPGDFGPPQGGVMPDNFAPNSGQESRGDAQRSFGQRDDRRGGPDFRETADGTTDENRERAMREFGRGGRGRGGFGGPGGHGGGPGGGPGGHGGPELDPLVSLNDAGKPLRSKLLQVPRLREKYLQYLRILAQKSFDWDEIGPFVAGYRSLLEKEVEADTRKLSTFDAFLQATADTTSEEGRSGTLRSFFEKRRAYLLSNEAIAQLPKEVAVALPEPKKEAAPEPIAPAKTTESPVVINEFLAARSKPAVAAEDREGDWIELFNRSDRPVDLSAMSLSDSGEDLRKWPFPEGTKIPPKGHLLVWADGGKTSDPGLHANFKLSKKGEEIFLATEKDGATYVVDYLRFEKQTDDVAFGRYPDGNETWQPLMPSPGAKNQQSE